MKRLRVFLSMLVTLAVLTVGVQAAAVSDFNDMPAEGVWSHDALTYAVKNGLLTGYGDGDLAPDAVMTRAEVATILNRVFGATVQADASAYTDLPADAWYTSEFQKAIQMHTFAGADGKMRPEAPITREEAFTVLARVMLLSDNTEDNAALSQNYSDADQVSNWAKASLSTLTAKGYISGSDGKINPKSDVTRAEFAQVMYNMIAGYVDKGQTLTEVPEGNVVLRSDDVTLKGVTVTGDLIVGDGVGEGNVYLEDVHIKGRLVIRGGGTQCIVASGSTTVDGGAASGKTASPVLVKWNSTAQNLDLKVCEGSSDVILTGKFNQIQVAGSEMKVSLENAEVNKLNVSGENTQVTADTESTVQNAVVEKAAAGAEVTFKTSKGKTVTLTGDGQNDQIYAPSTSTSTSTSTGGSGGSSSAPTLSWDDLTDLKFIITYNSGTANDTTATFDTTVDETSNHSVLIDLSDTDVYPNAAEIKSGTLEATMANGATVTLDVGYDTFTANQEYTISQFLGTSDSAYSAADMTVGTMRTLMNNFSTYFESYKTQWETDTGKTWPSAIDFEDGVAVVTGKLTATGYKGSLSYTLNLNW